MIAESIVEHARYNNYLNRWLEIFPEVKKNIGGLPGVGISYEYIIKWEYGRASIEMECYETRAGVCNVKHSPNEAYNNMLEYGFIYAKTKKEANELITFINDNIEFNELLLKANEILG